MFQIKIGGVSHSDDAVVWLCFQGGGLTSPWWFGRSRGRSSCAVWWFTHRSALRPIDAEALPGRRPRSPGLLPPKRWTYLVLRWRVTDRQTSVSRFDV
jgi:hypothetical protein